MDRIMWFVEILPTLVVGLALLAVVAAIVVYLRKSKKKGCSSCGGSCSGCCSGCGAHEHIS